MSALVDTDVLIDALRGTSAADAWLTSKSTTAFAVPGIVAMELVAGCRDQAELRQLQLWSQSRHAHVLCVRLRFGSSIL